MPGALLHQPAEIIQTLVVDLGLGTVGGTGGNWPVFYGNLPDLPDNLIVVSDTDSIDGGRYMINGERQEFHGFQVLVRADTKRVAYRKIRAIAVALDKRNPGQADNVYRRQVTVGGTTYCLHSVNRVGDVMDLGFEMDTTSKRVIYVFNAVTKIRPLD